MNTALDEPSENNLKRSARLVSDVHKILKNANSYGEFATNTADSKDATHRMRLFHDQFRLDAHTNRCAGTIYRSQSVIHEQKIIIGKSANPGLVHCEHAIPINLIARHIYENMKSSTMHELGIFLLFSQFVCAIKKTEQEYLSIKRSYAGIKKGWVKHHPNFIAGNRLELKSFRGEDIGLSDVLVFARYIGTDITMHCVLTNECLNVEKYTIADHVSLLKNHRPGIVSAFTECLKEINP